jgi:hypothetical protein
VSPGAISVMILSGIFPYGFKIGKKNVYTRKNTISLFNNYLGKT